MKQSNGHSKKHTRVVLDTNVLISSLIYGGRLKPIADLIEHDVVIPCFVETTFLEFQRVIHYSKFKPSFEKLSIPPEDVVYGLADKSIVLPDPIEIPRITEDISDDFVLASAIEAEASFIVSGDKFLVDFKIFQGMPILTPAQFLELMKERD
ncbi:MAG: putative toxin-antitoxin system toxin component, PIN family [Candidatus Portnoybacteria bacterium]|nr:putative toxin-antitoxin system toxin component, PIN family [Candidatus Portnoybacteria bacterium]